MPHIPQDKSDKTCKSPTYCTGDSKSCQYGDKAPLKPHIFQGGGGGVTLTGALTLTVPLSTQVYKWVPANLMMGGGGGNPSMD